MKRFLDWLRSLLAKFSQVLEKPDANTPITTQEVIRLGQPVVASKPQFDYSLYADQTPMSLQLIVWKGRGVPGGWDWGLWAQAANKPDPRTHDNRGKPIEPMPAFEDPPKIEEQGEMDLDMGETKFIHCANPRLVSWVAHSPQHLGPADVELDGSVYQGAYLGNIPIAPGVHAIKLVSGPKQGMRVAVR